MISTKTIIDKANTKITGGGLTELEIIQLSAIDDSIALSKLTVATVGDLPSVEDNKGRLVYVTDTNGYYFSDGNEWLDDFGTVLTTIGIAYGWGSGSFGNLGDGTAISRSSPVTVIGGITNWSQVSAGNSHSLGVTATGIAYAWGLGSQSALGDGTTVSKSSPVTVVGGITNWSQVSAGNQHSLGLTATGIAYAWGGGAGGRLGDGTFANRSSPVTVIGGITNWSQVSAGNQHSLGLTATGIAYAWGAGSFGRLGDGTAISKSSPVTVVGGITNWSQVSAANYHSLGLTATGIAYAWGLGSQSALGDGTTVTKSSPVTVVGGITNWSQVSAGGAHSLGLTDTGIAYVWGTGSSGRLGDGTAVDRSSPVTVVGGITNWSSLSGGIFHSVGLTADGIAYAWGSNSYGSLGYGISGARSSPVTVVGGITNWSQVSTNFAGSTNLALTTLTKGFNEP